MYNHQVLVNLHFASEAEVLNASKYKIPTIIGFINEKASRSQVLALYEVVFFFTKI